MIISRLFGAIKHQEPVLKFRILKAAVGKRHCHGTNTCDCNGWHHYTVFYESGFVQAQSRGLFWILRGSRSSQRCALCLTWGSRVGVVVFENKSSMIKRCYIGHSITTLCWQPLLADSPRCHRRTSRKSPNQSKSAQDIFFNLNSKNFLP